VPPSPTTLSCSAVTRLADTRTAAHELVERLDEAGVGPGAAILLFATFHHRAAFPEAASRIRQGLQPNLLLGTTAESVVGAAEEIDDGPGMSALALTIPGLDATPIRFDPAEGPPQRWSGREFRRRLGMIEEGGEGTAATSRMPAGILLFADPFSIGVPPLLDRLADTAVGLVRRRRGSHPGGLAPSPPIIGGLASGSSQPGGNVLLLDEGVFVNGAVGASLFGPLEVDALVSQGCRPIGRPFVVTAAEGHALKGLGGRPALAVAQSVAAELGERDRQQLRQGLLVGVAVDEHRTRFGRGDFLIRNVVAGNTRSSELMINDQIRPGRTIQFHVRDATTAREDLDLLLDAAQLRERPTAVLLVSGTSRGRRLFETPHHDAEVLQRRLGPLPLAGCFVGGEIAPLAGRSWLHGHTACAALIRATDPSLPRPDPSDPANPPPGSLL